MNKDQKIGAKMAGHAAAQALAADAGAAERTGQAVKDLAEQMYDSSNGVIDTMEDIQRSKYMALGEDLDPEKWSGKDKELLLGILNGFDPSSNDQRAYMAAVAKALGADPFSPPAPVDEGIFQDRLLAPEQDVQKGCLILVSQYLLLDENNRCCASPRDCAAAQRWFRHLAISEEEQNRLWAKHREFIQNIGADGLCALWERWAAQHRMPAEEDRPCAPGEAEALPPRYTETPFLDEIIYDTTARYQNAAEFAGGVIWENKEVRLDACFTVPAQRLCIQNSTIHFQDSIDSFFDLQNGAGLRFVNCRFDLCRTGAGKAPETRFRGTCGRLIFEKCRFEELSALVKTNVEDEAAFGLELQIETCDFFDCADAIACAGSSLDFKNNNVVFTKPGSRFLTVCQTAPVLHGCTFRLTCAGGTGGHALLSLPPKTVLQECGFYGLRAPFSVSGSLVLEKCRFEACRQLFPGDVPIKAAESRFLGCTRVTDAAVIKPEQPVAFELTACHFTECSETLLLRYAILNMDRCFFQNGQGTQIKLEDSVSTLSGSGFSHIQSDGTPLLLYSGKKPDAAVGADALRLARKKGWKAADRHLVDQCTFEDICLTGKAALLAVSDEDSDLTVLVRHCRFKEIEAAGPVFRTQGIRDVAYGLGDSHTYLAIDIDRESCEFAPGSIYDPQQATSDAKLRGPITPGTKAKKAAAAVGGAVLGLAVSPIVAGMVAVDTAKDAFDPDDPLRSGLKAASGFISAGLAGLVLSPLGGGFELMDNVEEEHTGQNKKKRKK